MGGVPPLCHKKHYTCMCLGHRPRHFQPPASKFFYCFLSNKFEKSSTHREILVQSCRNMPCLLVRMVNWLVEFWCTRCRDSAPPIKSPKFSRNIVFIHKRQKKIKSRPSTSFSEKKCQRNRLLFFWSMWWYHHYRWWYHLYKRRYQPLQAVVPPLQAVVPPLQAVVPPLQAVVPPLQAVVPP